MVASGVLIRFVDHHDFPNVWLGMWWALQTVTTVGYGDVVPTQLAGRIVGASGRRRVLIAVAGRYPGTPLGTFRKGAPSHPLRR